MENPAAPDYCCFSSWASEDRGRHRAAQVGNAATRGRPDGAIRTALYQTSMSDTQGDYTLIGRDLTSLLLQPGFVEGIVADHKRFATLENAYQHIFRRNLEYAV